MSERKVGKRWLFFLGVTLLFALPLAVAYLLLSNQLFQIETDRYHAQADLQLRQWQWQINATKWDAVADTQDDTLYLGLKPERLLLRQTLRRYVGPDGHCLAEGIAVINPDGSLRPSKLTAAIDRQGQPLAPSVLARLHKQRTWLDNPWLPDYYFVAKALADDPSLKHYISSLIQAPCRPIFVVASPRRDAQGRLLHAVMIQFSISQLFEDIFRSSLRALQVWLMDSQGTVGFATSPLARASAKAFLESGRLPGVLQQGRSLAQQGDLGVTGILSQELPQDEAFLTFGSSGGDFVLGAVASKSNLVTLENRSVQIFGAIAVLSLFLLASTGVFYTLTALRRESQTVELDTLRRYAGTLSHRVRNDLLTIQGQHELIVAGMVKDLEDIRQSLDTYVKDALDDVQRTVQELEALSRGEVDIQYEGQVGRDTLYQVKNQAEDDKSQ